jgi:hypothetical protein
VFEFSRVSAAGEKTKATKSVWHASALLGWIAVIVGGSIFIVVLAANGLDERGSFPPEIVLPLIVIVGVVALLATLAVAAATFGLFEIADKSQALGLPPGSVQAVIALSLILIFAVVALYASSSSASKELTSTGLTAAEVKAIPSDQLLAKEPEKSKAGGPPTYKITRRSEDEDLKDINTQLLTTVSTLVIAVAGFYFGSKSVQEGNQAAIAAAGPTRSLSVVDPNSPYTRYPKDPPLEVKVQTVPPGAALRWKLWNDDEGHLVRLESGTFVYHHGKKKTEGTATLYFEMVEDPGVSDSLVVNFGKEKEEDKEAEEETQEPSEEQIGEETRKPQSDEQAQRKRAEANRERLRTAAAKRPRPKPGSEEPPEAPEA